MLDTDFLPVVAASVLVLLTAKLLSELRSYFGHHQPKAIPIRSADTPAVLKAGATTALSSSLVTSNIVNLCATETQATLKAVSRGWRDAVREETEEWMFSYHELSLLAYLVEIDVDKLLAAKELTLPPSGVVGHLESLEGKGVGVLLRFNPHLTALSVRRNMLKSEGVAYIAAALKGNKSLTSLAVDANEVGDEGAIALIKSLHSNRTLTVLSMRENGLGPEDNCPHDDEPTIGDTTAHALAELLAVNDALRVLRISSCEIGDAGARSLAAVLSEEGGRQPRNTTLETLDMRENQLSDDGKRAMRAAMAGRQGVTLLV